MSAASASDLQPEDAGQGAGPPSGVLGVANGYQSRMTLHAPQAAVFQAIATVDGPRHWWTTEVAGSATPGGQLTFGFAGSDEQIAMRVDLLEAPVLVLWSCTSHTRDQEWTGSKLRFEISAVEENESQLDFRHDGLPAEVVAGGWDHFLSSLAAYVQGGLGAPFGA